MVANIFKTIEVFMFLTLLDSCTVAVFTYVALHSFRHEDVEDVLIIQPPQLQVQSRKEKHRRRHKDGRKKVKEDRYDEDATERHSSRKTDRQVGNLKRMLLVFKHWITIVLIINHASDVCLISSSSNQTFMA